MELKVGDRVRVYKDTKETTPDKYCDVVLNNKTTDGWLFEVVYTNGWKFVGFNSDYIDDRFDYWIKKGEA